MGKHCPIKCNCYQTKGKNCPTQVQAWTFETKITLAVSSYNGTERPTVLD